MPDELGTRDVVEQLDTRLGNLEQGQRDLGQEMVMRFTGVDSRFDQLRSEMESRFAQIDSRFANVYVLLVATLVGVVSVAVGVAGLWFKV